MIISSTIKHPMANRSRFFVRTSRITSNSASIPSQILSTKFEVKTLDHLNSFNPRRVFVTEAAYIDHQGNNLIMKKMKEMKEMKEMKLGTGSIEIETGDDIFELIAIEYKETFNQFLKVMRKNPQAN